MPNFFEPVVHWLRPYNFPGKARLLNRLVPARGLRRARVLGAVMDLELSDLIQRQIFLGCFERVETEAFKTCLRPSGTVVDAGANVGYFTLLAHRHVGSNGKILAIEPSPYAFAKLVDLIEKNGLKGVTVRNAALSESAGQAMISIPPVHVGNHSPTISPVDGWDQVAVATCRLDDWLDENNIEQVDLLKMDVEGHEPKVLAGARRYLAEGRIKAVLCEFNDYWLKQAGSSPLTLWKMLLDNGFQDPSVLNLSSKDGFPPGGVVSRLLVHESVSRKRKIAA